MKNPRVRLVAENLPDQRILEAIYAPECQVGAIQVDSGLTMSGAIGIAQLSLLQYPDRPVGLVLNSGMEDMEKCRELLGSAQRILASVSVDNWHVALAIPRLDKWAIQDARIQADFESQPQPQARTAYVDRAVRMAELVRQTPFDREALRQASSQFRGLDDFVRQHLKAAPASSPALSF